MLRVLLCACAALVLASVSLNATGVVVFQRDGRIVIGADSLVQVDTIKKPGDAPTRATRGECKIHRSGRWWFVLGGMQYEHQRGDDALDGFALIARAIAPAPTVRDALLAIDRELASFRPQLLRALASMLVISVVVAGMEGDRPTVGFFGVDVKNGALRISGATCPGAWCPDGGVMTFAGSPEAGPLLDLTAPPVPGWVEAGDAAAARKLLELQVAASPTVVWPPIDVLEITVTGARWVQRDQASRCKAL